MHVPWCLSVATFMVGDTRSAIRRGEGLRIRCEMLTLGPYGCRRRSLSYFAADLIPLVGPGEDGSFHWAYSLISPHLSFGTIASKSSAFLMLTP